MGNPRDIYEEIAEFIAAMNPKKILTFQATVDQQERFEELLEKEKGSGLTAEEKAELDRYLMVNQLVSLAKARARRQLAQ